MESGGRRPPARRWKTAARADTRRPDWALRLVGGGGRPRRGHRRGCEEAFRRVAGDPLGDPPAPTSSSRRRRSSLRRAASRSAVDQLTREEGKTLKEGIGETGSLAAQILRVLRRRGAAAERRALPLRDESQHPPLHRARAARRRRADHPLELPDRDPGLEDRPGARLRQHRRLQAGQPDPAPPPPGRGAARGGLPPGVLNLRDRQGSEVGDPLVRDERVVAISFTGSDRSARRCARSQRRGAPLQLEMGGKNPAIVLADADLDHAMTHLVYRRDVEHRPEVHRDQPGDRRPPDRRRE